MQLVEGEPLDVYVRRHALTRLQILNLVRTVIGAVQYAHQKG